MKFRKKPIVIEACRWEKNGDHPDDALETLVGSDGKPFFSEGKVVRYYRRPDDPGDRLCLCGFIMHVHGWIDTLEGGHIVCVGDWIITGVKGERYPCKPEVFRLTYEPATETPSAGDDYDWLEWFRDNADFGPAHEDVVDLMREQFEKAKRAAAVPVSLLVEPRD